MGAQWEKVPVSRFEPRPCRYLREHPVSRGGPYRLSYRERVLGSNPAESVYFQESKNGACDTQGSRVIPDLSTG
jgi:hypothetical protein